MGIKLKQVNECPECEPRLHNMDKKYSTVKYVDIESGKS
ncbi:hypothetical protein Mpsy_3058 [Methanolobus psychrophilus R15]|nr:hypothetical protein Mpsy_3058 [Methanolobus psychrophilus R15]